MGYSTFPSRLYHQVLFPKFLTWIAFLGIHASHYLQDIFLMHSSTRSFYRWEDVKVLAGKEDADALAFLFPYNRYLLKPAKGHRELSLTLQSTNSIYLWAAGSSNVGFCQPVNFFFS